jgi:hypothetical protein
MIFISIKQHIHKALDIARYLRAQNEEEEVDERLAEGRKAVKCISKCDEVTACTESTLLDCGFKKEQNPALGLETYPMAKPTYTTRNTTCHDIPCFMAQILREVNPEYFNEWSIPLVKGWCGTDMPE